MDISGKLQDPAVLALGEDMPLLDWPQQRSERFGRETSFATAGNGTKFV
jgi:hypothetical protein